MNSTIYKQYDSRWGKKAYPSGSTVGGCGCGLLACTHVAMEQESKKNWTPDNLRAWMVGKGFALRGQGTRWEGITETLKHIGHKSVVRIYNDPMSEAWKELNKGNRIGVLLFNGRVAPNGVRWTSGGHYVAFTNYRVKNGKHEFYTKDSGARNHSGWYSYENSMKGCIAKLWIVERVGKQTNGSATTTVAAAVKASTYKPTTAYKGSLPSGVVKSGSTGTNAKAVQTFLNWAIDAKLAVDGQIGAKSVAAIKVFQKTYKLTADGIFGAGSKKAAQALIDAHKPKTTTPSTPKKTTTTTTRTTTTPVVKKKTNADLVNEKALELAWAPGTPEKKYKRKGGAPTAAFKKAFKKRFPKGKINTGCHTYVRLVLRESIDPKAMPSLEWSKIVKYFKNSKKYKQIKVNYKQSQLKPGDIRIHYTSHSHHIWIIVEKNGKMYRAEANQGGSNERYAHLNGSTSGNTKKHKKDYLFRPV